MAEESKNLEANIICKCLSKLRNYILSFESLAMAEPISVYNIIKGEIEPLEFEQNFFEVLNTGSAFSACPSS